jgi:hypothetical protein
MTSGRLMDLQLADACDASADAIANGAPARSAAALLAQAARCIRRLLGYKKPPTTKERAAYFYVLEVAFANWPEGHDLQPYDVDELRQYLQLRAGWGHKIAKENEDGTREVYLIARSIKDNAITHAQFLEMSRRVYRILREETGIDHAEVLRAAKAAYQ